MEGLNDIKISRFPRDRKPLKVLLEIILNRKRIACNAPVRVSDFNSTYSSLNSSKDTLNHSQDILPEKKNNANMCKRKKRKTIEIKIKLDISDVSENSTVSNSVENEEMLELESTTIKKISSKLSLSTKDGNTPNETEKRVYSSTSMRKMSSTVSLSIKDDNKNLTNQEETVFFDIMPSSIQEQSIKSHNLTALIESELDGSHDQSFWHKIFEKIRNRYETSQDDKKIVQIIHELIMEKYKKALNTIKQRIENREQKHNKTKESLFEKSLSDYLQTKEEIQRNSTILDISNNEEPSENVFEYNQSIHDISNISTPNLLESNDTLKLEKRDTCKSVDYLVHQKCLSNFPEKCNSEDLISFESDKSMQTNNELKRKSLDRFLKTEGNIMIQKINKILESEVSLPGIIEEDIVDYDAKHFLKTALGDHMNSSIDSESEYQTCLYNSPTLDTPDSFKPEQSIGSSNISILMSDSDRRKSAGIYSLYSTVNKNFKKKYTNQGKQFATKSSNNDYGYESLDDLNINQEEKKLMQENVRQDEIIYQISKAVNICRSRAAFFGQDISVEAEKLLLVASLKKDVIDDELKKMEYENMDQRLTSSSVVIKNIEFYSTSSTLGPKNKNYDWYSICVVRQGSTIYSTKAVLQQDRVIAFPDTFHFHDLPSDFELHISIYGLMLKNKKNKKMKHRSHKDLKTLPSSGSDLKRSNFFLWGTTVIKPTQSNRTIFNLSQVPPEAPVTDIVKANIETTFKIHIKESGFLTVGIDYKGHPIWNRRWCVLDGSILRYWNYPNEEENCEPLGELDLLNCASHDVQRAEKDICPTPRTLLMVFAGFEGGKSYERKYFLAADNLADFERWQENLNLILTYLKKWNNFNCFLVN